MSRRSDGDYGELTGALWMFLLKEGGRWESCEVASRTSVDPTTTSQLLSAMSRAGMVKQFPIDGRERRYRYGVTEDCKFPRLVRLRHVVQCIREAPVEGGAA